MSTTRMSSAMATSIFRMFFGLACSRVCHVDLAELGDPLDETGVGSPNSPGSPPG